jgi:hypothetical protein
MRPTVAEVYPASAALLHHSPRRDQAEYAGLPPAAQPKLDRCRQRLQDGTYQALPEALRTYLAERLTQDAAERHINAGIRASQEFQALLDLRLTRPDGVRRKVATAPPGSSSTATAACLLTWLPGSPGRPATHCHPVTTRSGGPSTSTWSRVAGGRCF